MISSDLKERMDFLSTAMDYLRRELYDNAINLAQQRLDHHPGDMDAWFVIASCWVNMEKITGASEILHQLEQIINGWSQLYQSLGDSFRKKGMHQEAAGLYRKALTMNPDAQKSEEMKATIALLEEGSRPDEFIADDQASDIEQISSDFHTITLAELYIKQGHLTMARGVLKKIIIRDPQNTKVLKRLEYVETLMDKGNVSKQEEIVEELEQWLDNLRQRKPYNE
jgi:tetratricopeptide (TPR) repeat protein